MSSPLISKAMNDNLLAKIVSNLKDCIVEMKTEFEESNSQPLTDDSPSLNKFCTKLEVLLQIGMRDKTGFFGDVKGYWNFMQECLSNNKNLKDGIRFVKARNELKTNVGRGRALIRFSLVHHRLADTIQYCQSGRLSEWYTRTSIFYQTKLSSDLLTSLYDLNELSFDLDPRDSELDTTWPTFSRNPVGVVYNWRPPSRTGSIASLSSIPNLEVFPTIISTPNIDEFPIHDGSEKSFDSNDISREFMVSEEEFSNMKSQIAEAMAKCEVASTRIKELENELISKESCIKELMSNGTKLAKEEEEQSGSQDDIEKCINSNQEVTNGLMSLSSNLVANDAELESTVIQNDAVEDDAEVKRKQTVVSDNSQIDAYLSTIASLQRQLMDAVCARESLDEKLETLRNEIERLRKYEMEVMILHQDKKLLSDDIEKLTEELGKAKDERNALEMKSKEEGFFEKAFDDAMKDKALIEVNFDELKIEKLKLDDDLKSVSKEKLEIETKLRDKVAENLCLLNTVEDLQKIVDHQKGVISELEVKVTDGNERVERLENQHATDLCSLKELCSTYQGDCERLLKENGEVQKRFEEKDELCEILEKKCSDLEEKVKQLVEVNDNFDREKLALKNELDVVKNELQSSSDGFEERNSKVVLLEESVKKVQEECEEMLQKNEKLESDKSFLVAELQQKSIESEEKSAECETLKSQLKEMEEKADELENASESVVMEKDKVIRDLEEDLNSLSGSVQRREKMWENARESMEKVITEKEGRVQTLEKMVADGQTKERLVTVEKKAAELEESLLAVKLEAEIQMERARVELDDLKQCLGYLEHEKFLLQEQLKEKEKSFENERSSYQLNQQRWQKESEIMNSDIDALKKRIIKLVREKADLWQKTDDLSYEQKVRASYQWMKSTSVANCLICGAQFSVTVRKHHCRKCGRVLCYNCCNNWAMTPHSSAKERICNECIANNSLIDAASNSKNEDDSDSCNEEPTSTFVNKEPVVTLRGSNENLVESSPVAVHNDTEPEVQQLDQSCDAKVFEAVERQLEEHAKDEELLRSFQSGEVKRNETTLMSDQVVPQDKGDKDISLHRTGDVGSLTDEGITGNSAWSISGSAKAAVSWVSSAANLTTSFASGLIPRQGKSPQEEENHPTENEEHPENTSEDVVPSAVLLNETESETGRPNELPMDVSTTEQNTDSDMFDIISPEEVCESRLYPMSDPNITCRTVIRASDIEGSGLATLAESELWIKAGRCFAIPISVDSIGTKLNWQFTTQPKGISFSMKYKESDVLPYEYCVSLIPPTMLNSHQQPVMGELVAKRIGVYLLIFDNRSSRFSSKKLKYKLEAEMTELTSQSTDELPSDL